MKPCPHCQSHVRAGDTTCPHCGASVCTGLCVPKAATAAVLLGLVAGCNGYTPQPKYGVVDTETGMVDGDEDGWTIADGDCDDTNAAVHPEAAETAGDDVDSNCNEDDDT